MPSSNNDRRCLGFGRRDGAVDARSGGRRRVRQRSVRQGVAYLGLDNGDFYAFDANSCSQLLKLTEPDAIAGGPSIANCIVCVLRGGAAGNGGLTGYGIK